MPKEAETTTFFEADDERFMVIWHYLFRASHRNASVRETLLWQTDTSPSSFGRAEKKKNVNGPVNNCIMVLYGHFGTYYFGLFGFISIIRGSNEHRFCFLDWAWVRMPTNGRMTRSEYQTEPFEEKSLSELTSRTKYSVSSLYITPDITLLWTQREESSCKIFMASYIIPVERKNKKLLVF